jgi:hypothetical protein
LAGDPVARVPADVVRWFGAVQSQDFSPAKWSLGQRLGPRVHAVNAYAYRRAGLDDDAFARAHSLLADALDDGACRTRKELADGLGRAGLPDTGFGLGYVLMHAELDGLICSGPVPPRRISGGGPASRSPRSHGACN